jgi:hypothetical protein
MAGVETERSCILASVLLSDAREVTNRMAKAVNPYGDGRAFRRIRNAIAFHFGLKGEAPRRFRRLIAQEKKGGNHAEVFTAVFALCPCGPALLLRLFLLTSRGMVVPTFAGG